jgi:hypothetical protein
VEEPGESGTRSKVVLVVVVAAVVLATLFLCCFAIGQFGALVDLRLPPP